MEQQSISDYRRDGYLHLRSFFLRDEIEAIRRDALRVFEQQIRATDMAARLCGSEQDPEQSLFRLFRQDVPRFAS